MVALLISYHTYHTHSSQLRIENDFSNWQELLYSCQTLLEQKPEQMTIAELIESQRRERQFSTSSTAFASSSNSYDTQSEVSHLSGTSAASRDSGREGSIASGISRSSQSTTSSGYSTASSSSRNSDRSASSATGLTLASSTVQVGQWHTQPTNLTGCTQQQQSALTETPPSSSFNSLRLLPHTQKSTSTARDDRTRSPAAPQVIKECYMPSANGSNGSTSTKGAPESALVAAPESLTGAICRVCQRRKATLILTPCAHRLCSQCAPVSHSLCPVAMCGKVVDSCISVYLA